MKGKFTAVLFIIVFILIAAVVFTFLSSLDKKANGSPAAEPTNEVIAATAQPVTTPFAAPVATQTLTPVTPAPTPVPAAPVATLPPVTPVPAAPTPLPTTVPTSVPVITSLSSGSFSSDTGTGLNITADWTVQSLDQEQVSVTVTVSVISFTLQTQALPNSVNIGLDGNYVSLDAPAIFYDGGGQVRSALASHTFTVPLSANSSRAMALQVEWQYNGSYGGVELPVLECGGSINVSR